MGKTLDMSPVLIIVGIFILIVWGHSIVAVSIGGIDIIVGTMLFLNYRYPSKGEAVRLKLRWLVDHVYIGGIWFFCWVGDKVFGFFAFLFSKIRRKKK